MRKIDLSPLQLAYRSVQVVARGNKALMELVLQLRLKELRDKRRGPV